MRKLSLILLGVITLGLAACGGSEDTIIAEPPVIEDPDAPIPPVLATLRLITSNPQIPSDGALPVTITAFVRDVDNNFVEGQAVTFSADSGGLAVQDPSETDANGIVTAELSAAGNPENRTITVTAFAGDLTDTVSVQVTGTALTVAGPESLVQGDTESYTITLADSNGVGIEGVAITVNSSNGNTLSATSLTTDVSGVATVDLTAVSGGLDTLTASGLSLSATQTVNVTAETVDFSFVEPATGTGINLDTPQDITVQWLDSGVPQSNATIQFAATRGILSANSAMTDGNGQATVSIQADSAGPAVITATAVGGPSTSVSVDFIATNPTRIDLQADPFTIAPNSQSTITAVVRDPNNNLVQGQRVVFTLNDITTGTLSPGAAVTDNQGRAQTVYTSADTVSGSGGIVIEGLVESTANDPMPVVNEVAVTVARRELFVAIGTGNELTEPNTADYQIEFSVAVTDSEGNGVPDANVLLNVRSVRYSKGYWTIPVGSDVWVPFVTATCDDEDPNGNGIIDVDQGEIDFNNNGTIEAGNKVSVSPGAPITDDNGLALVNLTYAQQFGSWLQVKMEARASVAGTESTESQTFVLQVTADDVEIDQAPPGILTPPDPINLPGFTSNFLASPFGYTDDCANPL
ncbi:MAG: Ig-like domain-containing protein [Pseudomonadota bacterium]